MKSRSIKFYDRNLNFSKFLFETSENFNITDISQTLWLIAIFYKIWIKSRFFDDFEEKKSRFFSAFLKIDVKSSFSIIMIVTEVFQNFWLKSRFFNCFFSKIGIFRQL